MVDFFIVAALALYGLKSDCGSVIELAQKTQNSFNTKDWVTTVRQPKGGYLRTHTPKEILWQKPATLLPEIEKTVVAPPVVTTKQTTENVSAETKTVANEKLTIDLDKSYRKINISSDEILSYFDKKGEKKNSHEELGSFAIPNQDALQIQKETKEAPALK